MVPGDGGGTFLEEEDDEGLSEEEPWDLERPLSWESGEAPNSGGNWKGAFSSSLEAECLVGDVSEGKGEVPERLQGVSAPEVGVFGLIELDDSDSALGDLILTPGWSIRGSPGMGGGPEELSSRTSGMILAMTSIGSEEVELVLVKLTVSSIGLSASSARAKEEEEFSIQEKRRLEAVLERESGSL